MAKNGSEILNMSDEDFMNNPPDFDNDTQETGTGTEVSSSGSEETQATLEGGDTDEGNQDEDKTDDQNDQGDQSGEGDATGDDDDPDDGNTPDDDPDGASETGEDTDADGKKVDDPKDTSKASEDAGKDGDKADDKKSAEGKKPAEGKSGEEQDGVKPVDYEGFYREIMKPFKANGREIKLKTPDEAIRLMQMGAGYGRKLQDLQPYLKTVRMLEKNNLLDDEEKLSFLIDVSQKNPDAIKKLLKDSGIDPLDLNMEDNAEYKPRNHSVSDSEMRFQDVLREVQTHPTGKETIRIVNKEWDQESKNALWESPELLKVIQSQREDGIYDQITAEIDRQKLLGDIPPNTPFLRAYKIAGDALVAASGLKPTDQAGSASSLDQRENQAPQQGQRVLAKRAVIPKSQASNNEKARAASSPSSTPRKAAQVVNPLEMPDDEFLKQFEGRL